MKFSTTVLMAAVMSAATFTALPAVAQDMAPAEYEAALNGKRVLMVPMAMGLHV